MGTTKQKRDLNLVYFAIYCLIASLGWFITPPEPITASGMKVLSLFVAAVFGWSVGSGVWASLATLVLLPFTGIMTAAGVLAAGFGSDTFVLTLVMFIMTAYLEQVGVTEVIAAFLLTRKSLQGHPWRIVFMITFVAYVLGVLGGCVMAILLTWGFVYKICDMLGYGPHDKFSNTLIYGVVVGGMLCMPVLPWQAPVVVILNAYAGSFGETINYAHYFLYSIPFSVTSVFLYVALCKFVFRVDVSRLKEFDMSTFYPNGITVTKEQKIALGALVAFITIFLLPGLLPAGNAVKVILDQMGLSIKVIAVLLVLSFIKVDGKPVMNFAELATKSISWPMMLMMAVIFVFIGMLSDSSLGIMPYIASTFGTIFAGRSTMVFIIFVAVVTVALTNVLNNMVVGALMVTSTIPIALSLGINPTLIVYLICVCCCIALLLPSASAPSLLMFSNTQWVSTKEAWYFCIPTVIVATVVALLFAVLLF